jgi:hypothetical protein
MTGLSSTDMLRILILATAVLICAASAADASYCGQSSELAAAQARWAALRQSRIGPTEAEKICRAYGKNFYEAVEVRQAASPVRRQRRPQTQSRHARRRDRRVQQAHRRPVHRLVTRRAAT